MGAGRKGRREGEDWGRGREVGWRSKKGGKEGEGEQLLIIWTVGNILMGSVDGCVASMLISCFGGLQGSYVGKCPYFWVVHTGMSRGDGE